MLFAHSSYVLAKFSVSLTISVDICVLRLSDTLTHRSYVRDLSRISGYSCVVYVLATPISRSTTIRQVCSVSLQHTWCVSLSHTWHKKIQVTEKIEHYANSLTSHHNDRKVGIWRHLCQVARVQGFTGHMLATCERGQVDCKFSRQSLFGWLAWFWRFDIYSLAK
jgi:hypothetical protein